MSVLDEHLRRIADIYRHVKPASAPSDSPAEVEVLNEIKSARFRLQAIGESLGRNVAPIVKVGSPKGTWAHVYYVSFHDPINSTGPKEGFYPVFLMSTDQRQCWLSVAIAAASEGISGRGGWSKIRGERLKRRAKFLAHDIRASAGWVKGPVALGDNAGFLHSKSGTGQGAGRAYECGAIISFQFNPHDPPADLLDRLSEAFRYFDQVFSAEARYLTTCFPQISGKEAIEQDSAAITGEKAEAHFKEWALAAHPEWGRCEDKTPYVGFGYDFGFPETNLFVEVKGCAENLGSIRLTQGEWVKARELADSYLLAIVTHIDDSKRRAVSLVVNPYKRLSKNAATIGRVQITYSISAKYLRTAIAA